MSALTYDVKNHMTLLIISSIGFIVAFAWNNFFVQWVGDHRFIYAVAITMIGSILSAILYKL